MTLKNFLNIFTKIYIITMFVKTTECTITGLSYMDPFNFKPLNGHEQTDPCNPLYWYPKAIPEHCYLRSTPKPQKEKDPEDVVPFPVPIPNNVPIAPIIQPMPPADLTPHYSVSLPIMSPLPSVPFGVPILPSNPMVPVPGIPYPPPYPYPPQIGMVPGIRGLVSDDGGINILPFSDVYSDMLEKHKNKILRKRLRKLLGDYDRNPRSRTRHLRRFDRY